MTGDINHASYRVQQITWTNMTPRDKAVAAWLAADRALKAAQAHEMDCRREAFMACWPVDNQGNATIQHGTNYLDLGRGYRLQCVTGYNYSLNNKDDKVDMVGQHLGADVAASVFKWKPDLIVKGYRELATEHQTLVNSVLTVTPKTPSLKFVEP